MLKLSNLIYNAFAFPTHYEFKKKLRFSQEWIKTNSPWLTYSKLLHESFCLPCVIFTRASHGSSNLGVFVSGPLKTFYKATEILRRYRALQYHKNSIWLIWFPFLMSRSNVHHQL